MNFHPKISIIMPAYNAEKTIADSIQSVLNQTYSSWELVVINDGSKDKTSQIVTSFTDPRIILLEQVNSGVAEARNNGIRHANGKYIAFLDSDDLWVETKLAKQLAVMQNNLEIGLIYTGMRCFKADIRNAADCEFTENFAISNNYLKLLTHDFIPTLTVLTRKDVFNHIGLFDEALFGTEDWDMWIRIAKVYKIEKLNERLTYYREHSSGISKNRERQSLEQFKVIKKHVLDNHDVPKYIKNISLWYWNKK